MTVEKIGPCPLCGGADVEVSVEDGGKMDGVAWLHGVARCGGCGADQRAMVPVGSDRNAAAARAKRLVTESWNAWGRSSG